jgi:maltose alpha-D-glucosyltransferase/alpha-amylase
MAEGRTIPSLPVPGEERKPPSAALVCRPGPAMPVDGPGDERDPEADQSHTSVVLGDAIVLKAYRQLVPGLNPDLEMTAFLAEQAAFPAVPPLAGYAELVETHGEPTTVAMAQAWVPDAQDAYEALAEAVSAWILAPGGVTLEYATEVAAELGTLVAGLHVAVSDPAGHGLPEFAPRPATRDEVRDWAVRARQHQRRAADLAPRGSPTAVVLHDLAPRIAASLTVLEALPSTPEVIRAHGDLHLGQILVAPDGYRIIDFEGEPLSTVAERRAHRHPLRDVASMLRSLDHVGRSAARRAVVANGGPVEQPGLDLAGWLRRSRERFLDGYREGLREARVWVDDDPDLLLAFEVDKELYEVAYAATYLPSWLWAPTEGLLGLFEGAA